MPVGNQLFSLKSIVAVETAPTDDNLIISCCALVRTNVDSGTAVVKYSPLDLTGTKPMVINPITWVTMTDVRNSSVDSMYRI
ncbi:MAG: hypothetical protein Gaeavirus40_3, partial [Gaeavirus sp.]